MNRLIFPFVFILGIFVTACQQKTTSLTQGVWRGVMQTDSTIDIPFNFEVYDSTGTKQIAFLNDEERLNISEVSIVGDSVFIKTPLYDTEIRALLLKNELSGTWIKHLPGSQQIMPFSAKHGVTWRYSEKTRTDNK